jgi:hypothetical protein
MLYDVTPARNTLNYSPRYLCVLCVSAVQFFIPLTPTLSTMLLDIPPA